MMTLPVVILKRIFYRREKRRLAAAKLKTILKQRDSNFDLRSSHSISIDMEDLDEHQLEDLVELGSRTSGRTTPIAFGHDDHNFVSISF